MIPRNLRLPQNQSFFLFAPRQCGKSTLIRKKLEGKVWMVDLLLQSNFQKYLKSPGLFREEALYQIRQLKVDWIAIDEIQRLPELLNEVQSLIEQEKCKFALTGSSARKLKRGGANLLAGRAVTRRLYPFLCDEIGDSFPLDHTLQYGSLPSLLEKTAETQRDILRTYCETYLQEEIQAEGVTRNLAAFIRFLEVASQSFGEIINYSNVSRDCQVTSKTAMGYFQILEDTLIGSFLWPYQKSIRKQLSTHPKFFWFDNGVCMAAQHRLSDPPDRQLKGRLFEQWILAEIRARIHYALSETQTYFWRTREGVEVDLLLVRGGKITTAIEFKSTDTIDRSDTSGLLAFQEEHPEVPLYLICRAVEPRKLGDVTLLPWKSFLLEELEKFL